MFKFALLVILTYLLIVSFVERRLAARPKRNRYVPPIVGGNSNTEGGV